METRSRNPDRWLFEAMPLCPQIVNLACGLRNRQHWGSLFWAVASEAGTCQRWTVCKMRVAFVLVISARVWSAEFRKISRVPVKKWEDLRGFESYTKKRTCYVRDSIGVVRILGANDSQEKLVVLVIGWFVDLKPSANLISVFALRWGSAAFGWDFPIRIATLFPASLGTPISRFQRRRGTPLACITAKAIAGLFRVGTRSVFVESAWILRAGLYHKISFMSRTFRTARKSKREWVLSEILSASSMAGAGEGWRPGASPLEPWVRVCTSPVDDSSQDNEGVHNHPSNAWQVDVLVASS